MDPNNRDTREPATPAEYAAAEQRARVILTSPYASSPAQIEWALQFPGLEDVFWESLGERHAEDREILAVNSTSTPAEVAAIARLIAAAPALLAACRAARTVLNQS
jgi:hypothetical protein